MVVPVTADSRPSAAVGERLEAARTRSHPNLRLPNRYIMSGIAVGASKGHIVTKRNVAPSQAVLQKGKRTKSGEVCRDVVKEVAGFSPYERRIIELLRIGKDKRALKFAKKRLGTHLRAKRKREELTEALRTKRS